MTQTQPLEYAIFQRTAGAASQDDFECRIPKVQAIQPVFETFCNIEKLAAIAIRECL